MNNKTLGQIIALILVAVMISSVAFYAVSYFTLTSVPTPVLPVYPTPVAPAGQIVDAQFNVQDTTTSALLDDYDVAASLYSVGSNPFAYSSVDQPLIPALYGSGFSYVWDVTTNPGAYYMLVTNVSAAVYPTFTAVSVPSVSAPNILTGLYSGALNPNILKVTERSTPTIATGVFGYDAITGLYSHSVTTTWNTTTYTKAEIDLTVSVAGLNTKLLSGRLYLPVTAGVSYKTVTLNGVSLPVGYSIDSSLDGLTGYYVTLPDLNGGAKYVIQIFAQRTGVVSASTLGILYHDAESIGNPSLRWWTDPAATTITLHT